MKLKNEITRYLKKAVLAQVDRCIDFKNDEFYKISKEEFYKGEIDPNITLKLFKNNKAEEKNTDKEKEKIDENLYIIIAVKVIRTIEEGSQKEDEETEDLTGIYFIPAMLNKEKSVLLPAIEDNKLPWFPREFLKPMIEPELAIGDNQIFEQILSDKIYHIYDIFSWEEYLKFCIGIYETTTQCDFDEDYIYNLNGKKDKIQLENNIYIFPDKTINPTYAIKSLYENILNEEREMPLYEKFINLEEEKDEEIHENTIENRKKHIGQMGGKYGLSESQRESINNFNNLKEGEILAIKGPPGTGKTTLIQSIVANEYVKRAIKGELPPLIVASSTNNQAVTNIIESFGKIQKQYKNNLEDRWIEKVNNFAVYFPSKRKRKQAKEKNFQYTDQKGNFFIAEIEKEEIFQNSKEKFINEARKFFDKEENTNDITIYKKKIHNRLRKINQIQNELINIVDFFESLKIKEVEEYLKFQEESIEKIKNTKKEIEERINFWNNKYSELPIFWKLLSFIKNYKVKISNRLKIYVNEKEFDILEKYGITASNSNVMKTACKSCKYRKYEEKGLFLSEHRRCFDDIIKYCNKLVYNGKLNPLRGNKREDKKEDLFPKMGYKEIESSYSQKVGTSRNNLTEAVGIANWIKENYSKIFEYYKEINPNNVLGIITPFKAQAVMIRNVLKQILPKEVSNKITVGTIHVLQGGERKIIIMSTTYGKDEGCFFIDNNKSLMNVAVSRAEDSFLVFGNIECLKDETTSPSGLLKSFIIKMER